MKRNEARPSYNKNLVSLRSEWDQVVPFRHNQISSGEDISFNQVLVPTIKNLLNGLYSKNILDIGCGSGELTSQLLDYSEKVTGIDFSVCSINLAQKVYGNSKNIDFVISSIEEYAKLVSKNSFSIAIANMTLMTMPDLKKAANAIKNLLEPEGKFIATIPHPTFWPKYWGYEKDEWFDYNQEIAVEAPFRISNETLKIITTHIHRPLEKYIEIFYSEGFLLEQLLEPFPNTEIMKLYPEPWEYPRFLALKWVRGKE